MLAGQDFNLALFIDGLDELDGDHKQLIDLIRPFRSNPGTKICVSSRPWNVFVDAFSCGPSLRLQDLTRGDIELFVDGKFNSTPAFRELQDALPDDASRLMEAIIEKAQGVFLWVAVVVNTILESITEGDNLSDLKTMVNELPSDLSELYDGIWCRIKPRYIAHSSQLFQIYKAILGEESVITMWLANENDPYDTDLSTIAFGRIKLIIQTMKRRLDSRTRGLLEVTDGHVDYLHRSVAEWVNFKWSVICSEAPVDFDPNLALLKAVTVEMSRVKKGIKDGGHTIIEDFWRAVQACLRYAARVRDYSPNFRELIEILDRLDKQCAEVAAFNPRGDPVPPIYAGAFTPESIEKRQGLPHWSTTQVRNEPDISFLALTAQFAISPYVRAKVTAEPSLVIPGPESCSILSHAVFGLAGFTDLHVRDRPLESGFPGPTSRYQLIQFLIETEVAATTDDSIKKQESASRQLAIYQRLVDNRFNGGIVQMPDGSLEGYYEAVCKLFEMNSDTRKLKSLNKERGPGREDHISEKTDKKEPSKSTPRSRQRFVKRIQKLFKDKPSS
ncbi:hypothetical protein UCRPA7_4960 [Phaeoacremonium minimum UCRPA7]|uniref:DUF7791 domain-containing protein n=1 Tax=Phaeoacremonium minimum (strain UCR-PA7) TaxID=1286976 RepID=R8BJL5_PHAM7|nr:hypothetical protein UCRPA7_4960 [Phaeoacremonium minimum UCRPA7]EON99506.1 hypothetical protein UCRPA7_4960 [Phaeoacremonium minimum UCRPA7]